MYIMYFCLENGIVLVENEGVENQGTELRAKCIFVVLFFVFCLY
jgi:hypothetical protein